MSEAKEQNNKRPKDQGPAPTLSFDGSVTGPGSQIGPFRIERELGRGAVGVVYLAHDTKLDRSVAIKSLPAEVMANPKARSRFSREARLLASLNHPNIATIHEVFEEAEGVCYLVLEYVPGQTLAERIAGARLKPQEALAIAQQIAEAVAAAHEHDVIHRDLKPGNIKITPEGKVKVLDFGLAKVVGGEAADQHSTITEPGRVIGTPAYMSPEQARSQVTDKRSDIWSFGCVLYEMLTGQIPFKGETISDTLANILQTEPDWHALPQATSANIQVLVRRCLEKDPHRRLRDIGDAGIEISEALARPVSASVNSDPSRRALWKVAGLCVFAGLIVGAIAMLVVMRGPIQSSEPRPVRRYSITLDPENPVAPFREGGYESPIFTPDGRQLIYATETAGDKWLVRRPLDSLEGQRIPGTQGACWPRVSPDGRWLTFAAQSAIWKVPLAGGRPERITDKPMYNLPHVWEDENTLILGTTDGLSRFDLTTKELERLTTLDATPGYIRHFPAWLHRESGTLLFVAASTPRIDDCDLFTLSLETRKVRRLVENSWRAYILSGRLICSQKGRLMAAPFDARTLQIGPATNVTENRMATDQTAPSWACSPEGTLVYVPATGTQGSNNVLVWVDLDGNEEPLGAGPMRYRLVRVSGDTARPQVAADFFDYSGISTYDTGGASPIRRLIFPSEGTSYSPIWTSDNSKIVFVSTVPDSVSTVPDSSLFKRKAADGSGEVEILWVNQSGPAYLGLDAWTPDGEWLVASGLIGPEETQTGLDIVKIHVEGNGEVKPLLASDNNERNPALSPDGEWLAYVSDELGRDEVFVTNFRDLEGKWHVSTETEGGREPVWAPDGTAIYYRDGASLIAVSVNTEGGFRLRRTQRLFEDRYVTHPDTRNYDIHPDGKRFLMIKKVEEELPMTELIVVENWFEELKRLVPTGKNQ